MREKYSKLFLSFLILFVFSSIQLAQTNPGKGTRDANFYGMEIVFVVDVSVSMESNIQCVKDFILAVFQVFTDPVPGKNNFHLITFSDYATYHPSLKGYLEFRDKIGVELKKTQKEKEKRQNTYLKNGLWEVFDLIEKNFIQKVGVVLLISDGEDSRELDMENFTKDTEMSLKALRNIGFNVFPIFVNTGDERYMREDYMDIMRDLAGTSQDLYEIAKNEEGKKKKGKKKYKFVEIARNLKKDILKHANFNSPKLYSDFKKADKEWKRKLGDQEKQKYEIQVKNEKLDAKVQELETDLFKEQNKSRQLKETNDDLTLKNKEYKSDINTLTIILLSTMLLGIVGFLEYRHEWKWSKSTWKGIKRIISIIPFIKTQKSPADIPVVNEKTLPKKAPAGKKFEPQAPETPTLDTLWGKLLDVETKEEYDLMGKKNGYTPPGLEGVKFYVDNRDNKKVIWVRQEKGSIEFRDVNNEPCNNNCGYISQETRFVIIKNFKNNEEKKFEYHFFNKLEETFDKPLLDKKVSMDDIIEIERIKRNFIGREDILKTIKSNFKKDDVRHHYLICGVSNTGKTSLLRYMHNIFFPNDPELNGKCKSILFEFDENDYQDKDFEHLKNEIKKELESIDPVDKRTRLILIDEYDKIFYRFNEEFGEFLQKIRKENVENVDTEIKNFFIFAGQRGKKLLDTRHKKYIPEHTDSFVLKGLDDLKIAHSKAGRKQSAELIDNLLTDIGFPGEYFPDEQGLKDIIIKFSSGFPYFTKRILHQLIIEWLQDYTMNPITGENVKDVVKNLITDGKFFTIERACKYDEEFNTDLDNVNQVPIDDIISILIKKVGDDGKIKREDLKRLLTDYPTTKNEILKKRKEVFDKKINQLIDMGLILEDGKYLIAIPYMVFYGTEVNPVKNIKENSR